MGNLAQRRLSDLLTGTEENCASQAFSQLCHPCNRIISPCDSKHGADSPYRASAPQSVRRAATGPRALAAGWVTPVCVLGVGVHGGTKPQLCSHRPGVIRCRIQAGRSPGRAAVNWEGHTRGLRSRRDAQLWGGGCHTDTPPSTPRCSQMLLRLCDPRRGQHLLPQPGGNSPAAPAPGPPETSKPPPDLQAGVGALPSPCIPPQRGSRAPGKDNPEQSGRWVLSWGCSCPLAAPCPRLAGCVIARVVFFSGSPALI